MKAPGKTTMANLPKPDERELIAWLLTEIAGGDDRPMPCVWMQLPGTSMVPKRLEYTLDKWMGRGLWEFGVTLESGWFTPEGRAWAEDIHARSVADRDGWQAVPGHLRPVPVVATLTGTREVEVSQGAEVIFSGRHDPTTGRYVDDEGRELRIRTDSETEG